MYQKSEKALLVLQDGTSFSGFSFGAKGSRVGEVVFNTSMTGYQEILTDPSYHQQMTVLTYPHIGNVGVNEEDMESTQIWSAGLIIRDYPIVESNWRSQCDLHSWMKERNAVGISNIDTRHLTSVLRTKGALAGCIMSGKSANYDKALSKAKAFKGLKNTDLAKVVTCSESYTWNQGSWQLEGGYQNYPKKHFKAHIVVYDFGVKRNMLRLLVDHGYRLTVVPAKTSAADVLSMKPDGVLLSNGPGDPAPCTYAIKNIQALLQKKLPLLGICLGHQLLALASGAKTEKMKFGHHGGNHPVRDLKNRVMITSQNHGFAVSDEQLPKEVKATHFSLFDGTIQGIQHKSSPAIGFQGHPEASPGPFDMGYFFTEFDKLVQQKK